MRKEVQTVEIRVERHMVREAMRCVRKDAVALVAHSQGLFISSQCHEPFDIGDKPCPNSETGVCRIWALFPSVELAVERAKDLGVALRFGKALEAAGMPVVMSLGFTTDALRNALRSLAQVPENEETREVLCGIDARIEAIEKSIMEDDDEDDYEGDDEDGE